MFYNLLTIIGSLGLFLYGMKVMSDGIQKSAGDRLQKIMNYMTINRFAAIFTGLFVTAIIQSSSATTVMVVSFVNAGLLSVVQSLGVIMGANIGTTITGWIVAIFGFKFKIITIALPAIAIGFPMLFIKKTKAQYWGETLIGFGILFLGLDFLKNSVPDIKSHPELLQFLTPYTNLGFLSLLLFILIGTILTIIVQSSSATMAITLTMAYAGWIEFHTAAAMVLGENIGTTITAYIASISTNINAKRAARGHMVFNLIGVIWMLFLFHPFLTFIDFIIPGEIISKEAVTLHLAMFHTIFNITNTILLIGFVPLLEKIVIKLVPEKNVVLSTSSSRYQLKYLSIAMQGTAEINLLNAKKEIVKMAEIVQNMFRQFAELFCKTQQDFEDRMKKATHQEDLIDQMEEQIIRFLVECTGEELDNSSSKNVNIMIRIVRELENIADSCYTLLILCQRKQKKNIILINEAILDIDPFIKLVQQFIQFNKDHLGEHLSSKELENAYELENQVNDLRKKLKKTAQIRLEKGSNVKSELLYIDILRHIENIGDHCLNISQALFEFDSRN